MERYQVILAYDGTDFHGSQYQTETRTVQNVLESVLLKLGWSGKSVLFAGRTDAGVHASGQVVAFDLAWNHSPGDLQNALNALLPADVSAFEVTVIRSDFHPRFDAIARTYRYRIYCNPVRDPQMDRFAWRVWPAPNFDRLAAASQVFLGIHDFAGFGRPTSPGGRTTRYLMAANWLEVEAELHFVITANAFLYHMVRRLVYVQVMVGQGKLGLEDLQRHLQAPGSEPIQGLAPPQGLTLIEVSYPTVQTDSEVQT